MSANTQDLITAIKASMEAMEAFIDETESSMEANKIVTELEAMSKTDKGVNHILEFATIIAEGADAQCQPFKGLECLEAINCEWVANPGGGEGRSCVGDGSGNIPPLTASVGQIEVLVHTYNKLPMEVKARLEDIMSRYVTGQPILIPMSQAAASQSADPSSGIGDRLSPITRDEFNSALYQGGGIRKRKSKKSRKNKSKKPRRTRKTRRTRRNKR